MKTKHYYLISLCIIVLSFLMAAGLLFVKYRKAHDQEDSSVSIPISIDTSTTPYEKGVDLSTFNTVTDWEKVKESGIQFCILRIGRRGTTLGGLYEDEKFAFFLEGVQSVGLDLGVYFFTSASSVAEAEEEAQYVIALLNVYQLSPKDLALPVFVDIEDNQRMQNLTPEEKTEIVLAFCEEIANAGYQAGIYSSYLFYQNKLSMKEIAKSNYAIWLAHYTEKTDFSYSFSYWQYTQSGFVDGIEGEVDLNKHFK